MINKNSVIVIIVIIECVIVHAITQSIIDYHIITNKQKNIMTKTIVDGQTDESRIDKHTENINLIMNTYYNIIYWRGSIYSAIIILIIFIIYNKLNNNNILSGQYIILFLLIFIVIYCCQAWFGFHCIKYNYDILQKKIKDLHIK